MAERLEEGALYSLKCDEFKYHLFQWDKVLVTSWQFGSEEAEDLKSNCRKSEMASL